MKTQTILTKELYTTTEANELQTSAKGFQLTTASVNLPQIPSANNSELLALLATFGILIAGSLGAFYLAPQVENIQMERWSTTVGATILVIATALFLFKGFVFLYHLNLFRKYKAIESVSDAELPTVTVIVPAYNEGKLVYDTLISLANSDYPSAKMQLLTIDDGSKDDTWSWIQLAKHKLGDRVSIFQQPKNMGKRHALYRGFTIGTGEVFVTVDSDSVVNPDTLRNLVSPIVTNKECGAVAGNVAVLNEKEGIFPKMLNVSFVMSFEFKRSAESVLGSVLCTPGALAAYKRDAVLNCLEDWMNQTFMGKASDIGEDRALTNMILKQGKQVLFQRNAYVYTNVPETYTGLHKMFTRWGRSNVREHINMAKYVFQDYRESSKFGPRLLFVNDSLRLLLLFPLLALMCYLIGSYPLEFLSTTLLSIFVISSFSVGFFASRYSFSKALWGFSYSLLYTFGLFWITPYALLTAGRSGWLTRELPQRA